MDKQEATNHVLSRLKAGNSVEEIVDELRHILNAPPNIIMRFVDKVIFDHPDVIDQFSAQTGMPNREEPFTTPNENPSRKPLDPIDFSDLPPGLQSIINNQANYPEVLSDKSVTAVSIKELSTSPNISSQKVISDVPVYGLSATERDEESPTQNLSFLSEFVLKQLSKGIRHSDIVEQVCDQTGWHWNKSQRFVARIQTENYDKLKSSKNRLIIFIGIGIIIIGLVITINSFNTLLGYAKLTAMTEIDPEALLSISPQSAILALAAMVTGIGMIIGGGYGISQVFIDH